MASYAYQLSCLLWCPPVTFLTPCRYILVFAGFAELSFAVSFATVIEFALLSLQQFLSTQYLLASCNVFFLHASTLLPSRVLIQSLSGLALQCLCACDNCVCSKLDSSIGEGQCFTPNLIIPPLPSNSVGLGYSVKGEPPSPPCTCPLKQRPLYCLRSFTTHLFHLPVSKNCLSEYCVEHCFTCSRTDG